MTRTVAGIIADYKKKKNEKGDEDIYKQVKTREVKKLVDPADAPAGGSGPYPLSSCRL